MKNDENMPIPPKSAVADNVTAQRNAHGTHEQDSHDADLNATKVTGERTFLDGREQSDAEFLKSLAFDGGLNNVLPKTPDIEGYHVMWESTMDANAGNLRHRLDNLGYTFVKLEECPGYHNHTSRTSMIPGVVSYNELVAVKIKKGREQMIAKRFHHDMPLVREAAIRKKAAEMADYEGRKVKVTMDEGTRELGVAPQKTPSFSV